MNGSNGCFHFSLHGDHSFQGYWFKAEFGEEMENICVFCGEEALQAEEEEEEEDGRGIREEVHEE